MSGEQKDRAAQEAAYHAALIRYARGEGSREEVRRLNPDRETIRKYAEIMADEYAKGK